ncbi:MAG: hypothetical protein ABSE89_09355 [Sedimentisphaerales bacterium]
MLKKIMTYSEAIEKVLLDNNYFAPLKKIYREINKYRPLTGKTPFNTIQERVQRDPRFTKIGLGVYALTEYLNQLPRVPDAKTKQEKENRVHFSVIGMLLEIGNTEGYETYSPNKNAIFENKTLSSLMTVDSCPEFTFQQLIGRIKFIDVLWFNDRAFPKFAFEVQTTPQFRDIFVKYADLVDFYTTFYTISRLEYKHKYERELSRPIFKEIRKRCFFKSFEQVDNLYLKSLEKAKISAEFFA